MNDPTKPFDDASPPEIDEPTSSAGAAADPDQLASAADGAETVARQRDEYYDRLLRKTAEFDNYRKRTERERRELADRSTADLLSQLLPIVDDLERALDTPPDGAAAEAYRAGVELIHKQLLELLARRGVTPIETLGQPFDPNYHQAVAREIGSPERDGFVIDEFRRGYMLGERLLRAAMVKVSAS